MFLNLVGKYHSEEPVDKKTRAHFKKIFDEIDTNGDGKLSVEEIKQLAQKMDKGIDIQDLNRIKYHLDLDDDLYLELDEFIPFLDLISKNMAAREKMQEK
ncbi:MAG: hypothetical protein BYD32DRAFT_404145 [Podila humilis]|nr:MAG: hypothetical protein BYD32DRAFT_404145 [Podila humilis]